MIESTERTPHTSGGGKTKIRDLPRLDAKL